MHTTHDTHHTRHTTYHTPHTTHHTHTPHTKHTTHTTHTHTQHTTHTHTHTHAHKHSYHHHTLSHCSSKRRWGVSGGRRCRRTAWCLARTLSSTFSVTATMCSLPPFSKVRCTMSRVLCCFAFILRALALSVSLSLSLSLSLSHASSLLFFPLTSLQSSCPSPTHRSFPTPHTLCAALLASSNRGRCRPWQQPRLSFLRPGYHRPK
jgi:hypothetical protein